MRNTSMVITADMRPFSVVVATCKHTRGIGAGGKLPWRLRADMAFFKQLTRSTSDPPTCSAGEPSSDPAGNA